MPTGNPSNNIVLQRSFRKVKWMPCKHCPLWFLVKINTLGAPDNNNNNNERSQVFHSSVPMLKLLIGRKKTHQQAVWMLTLTKSSISGSLSSSFVIFTSIQLQVLCSRVNISLFSQTPIFDILLLWPSVQKLKSQDFLSAQGLRLSRQPPSVSPKAPVALHLWQRRLW